MFCRRAVLLVLAAAGLLLGSGLSKGQQQKKDPEAVVLSPKEGTKVSQSEEVEGQLHTEGWPVILVRPLGGSDPWWVQSPVEELVKGKFTTQVQFGNDQTTPGTKFRVLIVVVKTKAEAHKKFPRGMTRNSLPAGLPKSEPVNVIRE